MAALPDKEANAASPSSTFLQKIGVPLSAISTALHNDQVFASAQQMVKNRAVFCHITSCFECFGIDAGTKITPAIVEQIRADPEQSRFLHHLKDQDWDTGIEVDLDDPDSVTQGLGKLQGKHKELEADCSDKAYQKCVNAFYVEYFTLSVVNLCLSWWKISDTINNLQWAQEKLAEYAADVNDIHTKYVDPIKQYHHKLSMQGVIDNIHEHRMYETMIGTALDSLNRLQARCREQQEMLNREARQNTMGAISMGHSGWTSWGLASVFPEAAVAMKLLAAVQVATSVAHGVSAVKSYQLSEEFTRFEQRLVNMMRDLKQIKEDFARYGMEYDVQAAQWDTQQVVQWTKAQDARFDDIAEAFERENIDGKDLLEMDHDTLEELGMDRRLWRKRLLRCIVKLQQPPKAQ